MRTTYYEAEQLEFWPPEIVHENVVKLCGFNLTRKPRRSSLPTNGKTSKISQVVHKPVSRPKNQ